MNETTNLINTSDDHIDFLFDEYGRRKVQQLGHPANPVSRRYFRIDQPEIDFATIFERITRHLGKPSTLTRPQFEDRANAIIDRLAKIPALKNMTRGVHVPFFLPASSALDLGKAIEERYIPSVGSAFVEAFPNYCFENHNKIVLSGNLDVEADSRHGVLIQKMQDEDVVGYYFPCLSEFSVPATLEQMAALPVELLLAGGYDTCAALVGSPGLLKRREGYPNLLWLAAIKSEMEGVGYHFEAYGQNLTFNRRTHFGQVSEYWSGGLVVLG
ncbi:MAG: hypothetical protein WCL27_01085 [Betaproteobacteria bacterium]